MHPVRTVVEGDNLYRRVNRRHTVKNLDGSRRPSSAGFYIGIDDPDNPGERKRVPDPACSVYLADLVASTDLLDPRARPGKDQVVANVPAKAPLDLGLAVPHTPHCDFIGHAHCEIVGLTPEFCAIIADQASVIV